MELAQDLKAIHGLDAETELANILSAEILNEINREVVRTIYVTAKKGAQTDTANGGIFDMDVDSNGRWSVEKFKGLMFQVERDANAIGNQETRRGKGNMIICSSDVASALQMAGVLDYTPALNNNLNVDDAGNTFAGVLNGRYKVYIDPYVTANQADKQYYTVGYKGTSPYDAGIFYCRHTFHFRWFVQLVRTPSSKNRFQDTLRSCCKPIRWWYNCQKWFSYKNQRQRILQKSTSYKHHVIRVVSTTETLGEHLMLPFFRYK